MNSPLATRHSPLEPSKPPKPPQPVRLALVTRRYPPLIGGAERVLSYLAEALAREGAEVTVLTSRAAGTEGLAAREDVPVAGARGGGRLTILRLATSRVRFVGT